MPKRKPQPPRTLYALWTWVWDGAEHRWAMTASGAGAEFGHVMPDERVVRYVRAPKKARRNATR